MGLGYLYKEDGVALSWQCETAEGNKKPRRDLFNRAEHAWLDILIDYCHVDCASSPCKAARGHHISPSAPELIGIFQDIWPILFRSKNLYFRFFRDWLSNHARQFYSTTQLPRPNCLPQAQLELRQKTILKEFHLTQLDVSEADKLFDGFCTRGWGYDLEVTDGDIGPFSRLDLAVSYICGYYDVQ